MGDYFLTQSVNHEGGYTFPWLCRIFVNCKGLKQNFPVTLYVLLGFFFDNKEL